MTRSYFITATGTGVGKTYVTASLLRQMPGALGLKPVITGYPPSCGLPKAGAQDPEILRNRKSDSQDDDVSILLKAQGKVNPNEISPWRFAAPLSPDVAAAREGKSIVFSELVEWCRGMMQEHPGVTLIEGVGGVMVPLDERHTVLDWIVALKIPVVLVAGSYLGTISHTLTSIAALKGRGVGVHRLVISESPESPMELAETAEILERFSGLTPVLVPKGADAPVFVQ